MSSSHRLLRRSLAALLTVVPLALLAPAASQARASDETLLAAIRAQAPNTLELTTVLPSPDGERLAIETRSRDPRESYAHDNLWIVSADAARLTPVQVADELGSGTEYIGVHSVGWSTTGRALTYVYANSSARFSRGASIVWIADDGSIERQGLGALSDAPRFTADGRYLVFTKDLGLDFSAGVSDNAVDLATRAVFTARTTWRAFAGQPTPAPVYALACKRAQEPDWVPAVRASWLEGALSSPDPGCRFGANANDPGPAPSPSPTPAASPSPTPGPSPAPAVDPSKAEDAPASITRPAQGTGLVPISDRPGTPLGPTVRLRSSAKGLTRALVRGLRIKLDLAGATSLKAYVMVARPAGENLFAFGEGSTSYTIGRLSLVRPPSQTQTIAIPFTREARSALTRFLKITVTVRLVATDAAGNRTVVERQIALTDF